MSGGAGKMLRDQPILVGCLFVIGLGMLMVCGFGALVVIGGKAAYNQVSESSGVDSMFATVQDAAERGFGFNLSMNNGDTMFSLVPLEAKTVTCDDVQAVIFPHLTGTLETVHVESQSILLNDDGSYTTIPLTCTWGGWPGKDGSTGTLQGGAPPVIDIAPAPVGSDEPVEGEEAAPVGEGGAPVGEGGTQGGEGGNPE